MRSYHRQVVVFRPSVLAAHQQFNGCIVILLYLAILLCRSCKEMGWESYISDWTFLCPWTLVNEEMVHRDDEFDG